MERIEKRLFMLKQPNFPDEKATDEFYFNLANRLVYEAEKSGVSEYWGETLIPRMALCVIGYYQDVIAVGGIWRGFVNEMRRLYGKTLPFFHVDSENYIDYELNPEDILFLVWYSGAMQDDLKRDLYPHDGHVKELGSLWYEILEKAYDEAPEPLDYRMTHEMQMHAVEDQEILMHLSQWVSSQCWLITPADALTMQQIVASADTKSDEGLQKLQERVHEALTSEPIGPLALYLREWMYLFVEDRMPPVLRSAQKKEQKPEYPGYRPFLNAAGGLPVKTFATYDEMNDFLINVLGWSPEERHLSQLEFDRDFVLMVDPEKGLLVAKNIARCLAFPGNSLYDKDYASRHAFSLLTRRGQCPGDLLRYICSNGWLPDAKFPGSKDYQLVSENWDFIARCYLELYYRGD